MEKNLLLEKNNKLLDDSSLLVTSRNKGLAVLSKLLLVHDKGLNCKWLVSPNPFARLFQSFSNRFAEELFRVLGFYRLLLFLQTQIISSPVVLAANYLVLLLSVPHLLARFCEGVTTAGANGWTRSSDVLIVLATQQQQQQQSSSSAASASAEPVRLGRTFSVASSTSSVHHQLLQSPACWVPSRWTTCTATSTATYVLYILPRPAESVSEQMSILEALHKLTTHRYVSVRLFTFHKKK